MGNLKERNQESWERKKEIQEEWDLVTTCDVMKVTWTKKLQKLAILDSE